MDAVAFQSLLSPGIAQLGGVLWDWALEAGGAAGGPARADRCTPDEITDA